MARPVRRHARTIAAVTAALTLGALAVGTTASSQVGTKTLVGGFDVGPGGTPGLFNPLTNTAGFTWLNKIYSTLVLYDVNFQRVQGDLASSWRVTTDGLKYTFTLRPNLTWHDGKPLTSEDVKFTLDLARNPEVGAIWQPRVESIRSVEAPNPATVVINLTRPNAALLDLLSQFMILPKHALGSVAPKDIRTSTWFSTSPIGSGPFKWSKYVPDQYNELDAFPGYWRGRPKLDKLVNRYFKEAGSAVIALRKGDIHFTYLSGDEVRGVRGDANVRVIAGPSQVLNYVGFNNSDPRFKDLRVRQAFMYAIDRKTISDQLYNGAAVVQNCLYFLPKYQPAGLEAFEYNPEKAKQLLSEAGWDRIKGAPIEFLTYYGDQLSSDVQVAMQQMLAKVGIDVRPRRVDVPTYNQITSGNDFALVFAGLGVGPDPDTAVVALDSNNIPPKGGNRMKVVNPNFDRLFAQGQAETNTTKRNTVYQNICKEFNATLPWAPMWVAQRFGGVTKNVSGFVWTPAPGGGRYNDQAHLWTVR
ncbi:MAG TPA: ABC transporter substrate-binding protein [Deinococcales bacterium]|nr:ABC transporter substrate-binding protein [Deinococcales bacterium]